MTDVRTWWKTSRVGIRSAVTRARRQGVIDDFHLLYYYGDTWKNT
jgi:hypothetical protein